MPSKPHKPLVNPAECTDPVAEAGDRLAAEVRCLREVMDDVREDLSWLTRNGLPVQPVEHVHVKRMARDVTAPNWDERLVVERTMLHPPGQLSGIATPELRRLAEELQSAVEHLLEGKIGPVLKAVDEVQAALKSGLIGALTGQKKARIVAPMADTPKRKTGTSPKWKMSPC